MLIATLRAWANLCKDFIWLWKEAKTKVKENFFVWKAILKTKTKTKMKSKESKPLAQHYPFVPSQ